ncbi:PAS domain-containing protein [Legionella tunisiensis]|uniref:PAS domain-containing protein n=1 Tax=Legionella tunisiensis TaxID=1034944 RepID=UPI00031836C4|nr:PAS domain-containing protein [Legionella tunisiensis]
MSKNRSLSKQEIAFIARHFEDIFKNLPGWAYIKDIHGVYIICNTNLAKDFGFTSPDDLIGKSDFDLASSTQAKLLRDIDIKIMESGEPEFLEEVGTKTDGTPITYLTRRIPIKDKNNHVKGILRTSEDITNLKKQKKS